MMRVLLMAVFACLLLTACGNKDEQTPTDINPWGLSDDGALLSGGNGDFAPGDMPLGMARPNFYAPGQYPDPKIAAEAAATLRTLYFRYNAYDIQPEGEAVLQGVAAFMKKYPQLALQIEGHCDERGTSEYNMALGSRRSGAVREYLVNLGVDSMRLFPVSYGEEQPAVLGSTEEAYSKNRRAEFKIGDMK